jgi:hypothetical protein
VAFVVFDGDGFILQVHGVFTHIRSGVAVMASYSGAPGSKLYSAAAMHTSGDSWLDLLGMTAAAWGEKPWLLFISQRGPSMAGWISLRSADSAAARDLSNSTSRHASPRGLGYFYSTSWEAARFKSISGHILQDNPSIREEVLDSRLRGYVPHVLRYFLQIFRDILAKTSDGPSARVYNST